MTDQQQPPQPGPQVSLDQFYAATGQAYGVIIGRLTADTLELKQLLAMAQGHITRAETDQAETERQNTQLVAGAVSYEGRIHELEAELAARPTHEQVAGLEAQIAQLIEAGPTVAQMAELEMAKAEAGKEKAAPEDG